MALNRSTEGFLNKSKPIRSSHDLRAVVRPIPGSSSSFLANRAPLAEQSLSQNVGGNSEHAKNSKMMHRNFGEEDIKSLINSLGLDDEDSPVAEKRKPHLTLGDKGQASFRRNSQYVPSLERVTANDDRSRFNLRLGSDYGRRPESCANSD